MGDSIDILIPTQSDRNMTMQFVDESYDIKQSANIFNFKYDIDVQKGAMSEQTPKESPVESIQLDESIVKHHDFTDADIGTVVNVHDHVDRKKVKQLAIRGVEPTRINFDNFPLGAKPGAKPDGISSVSHTLVSRIKPSSKLDESDDKLRKYGSTITKDKTKIGDTFSISDLKKVLSTHKVKSDAIGAKKQVFFDPAANLTPNYPKQKIGSDKMCTISNHCRNGATAKDIKCAMFTEGNSYKYEVMLNSDVILEGYATSLVAASRLAVIDGILIEDSILHSAGQVDRIKKIVKKLI